MIRLVFFAVLAALAHLWVLFALLLLPVAVRVGFGMAVRRNGVSMMRTGARRATTGRF